MSVKNILKKLLPGFLILGSVAMAETERVGAITFQGAPLTLVGKEVQTGKKAPNFSLTKNDLSELTLKQLKGKTVVISSIVSIDTPVCELQTIKFNQEASQMKDVVVLTVSTDTPFALDRFCGAKGIKNTITASDYKTRKFSKDYGLFIKELALSSRAVIIIDKNGNVAYKEYLKEITNEPNYDKAMQALKSLNK